MGNANTPIFKKTSFLLLIGLVVIGGGVAAWLFMKAPAKPYIQLVNGFDFPVTATVSSEGSDEQAFEIPAHGRVGADFTGKHTVEVTLKDGKVLSSEKVNFGERKKERCQFFYNVLGSAAIIEEEVDYGIKGIPSVKLASGQTRIKLCPTWGFETAEPPKAIKAKKGKLYATHKWMHYIGDGGWDTSVAELVRRLPNATNKPQRIARAQRIVRAVRTHDPDNQHLAALQTLFEQNGLDFPEDYREVAKLIASKKQGAEATKAGRWSAGGKGEKVYLSAAADNTIHYLMKDTRPLLIMRCVKNKPLVYVQTGQPSKMEIHGTSANRHTVSLAFDDEAPVSVLTTEGAKQSILVLPQPVHMFRKLLESDTLVFRHHSLGGEQIAITFDLRDLDQVIGKLEQSCRWAD